MRLAVFGATGETGQLVVRLALEDGHHVAAYARNPAKLTMEHVALRVVRGELDDEAAIDDAVTGSDAIISLLGPPAKSAGLAIAGGTERILRAMQRHGVMRLVATSTPSAPDPRDRFDVVFTPAVWLTSRMLPGSHADIVRTAEVIRASDRAWTMVRLPVLTSKPAGADLRVGFLGRDRVRMFSLSRVNLAAFLIAQVADETYLRQAPVISN